MSSLQTGIPVCIVLISTAVWDCLQGISTVPDPFQVHFPNYTRESFQNILGQNPVEIPDVDIHHKELWVSFVLMLVDNYASVCNDLHELQHLAQSLFPLYCQPVIRGEGILFGSHNHMVLGSIHETVQSQMRMHYTVSTKSQSS